METKQVYTTTFETARTLGQLLAPEDFKWDIIPDPHSGPSPLVIHVSCNAHFTPFIPHLAHRILKRLGLDAVIVGGPENCCGFPHHKAGDFDLEPKVAEAALNAFARLAPTTVLSVCPDCDDVFSRFKEPSIKFKHTNISELFIDHLDTLKTMMKPLPLRVVPHFHDVSPMRRADAERMLQILRAIPGVEILPAQHAMGCDIHCQTWKPMPPDKQEQMFVEAKALGADAIVVPYHSCYRQHCKMQLTHGLETQHYMGVLATALGIEFDEPFKRLRLLDNVDAAVAELRPKIVRLGFREDDVRKYVQRSIYC
jgi:heterodisulfide reductase subunit D